MTIDDIIAMPWFMDLPPDENIGWRNVSQTQLSLARMSGAVTVNGKRYTYVPATDELIRDDIIKRVQKWQKEQATKAPDSPAVAGLVERTVRPTHECEHGQLARSCDRCADAAEIAELRAEAAANFARAREWAQRAGELEAMVEHLKLFAVHAEQEHDRWKREALDLQQTCGDLCDACGWRFVVPDRGCLNCGQQHPPATLDVPHECRHAENGVFGA